MEPPQCPLKSRGTPRYRKRDLTVSNHVPVDLQQKHTYLTQFLAVVRVKTI